MAVAAVFALFLVLGVGLALALLAVVWGEWPDDENVDRDTAEAIARRDRDR